MPRLKYRAFFGIALALLSVFVAEQVSAAARFGHMTMEDGLSASQAFTIIQDKRGYLWISTENGVNRYDGYTFRIFKHDANDPNSLSGGLARALYEDPEGRLWVGTFSNGLDLYDPATNTFKRYRHIAGDPGSIGSDSIWTLNSAPNGNLIIGTYDAGIDILDLKSGVFHHYPAHSGPNSPDNNTINCIFIDHQKHIWIGTGSELEEIDSAAALPARHFKIGNSATNLSIWGITEDDDHRLWLATQAGPYTYTPGDSVLRRAIWHEGDHEELEKAYLHSVMIDDSKNIWFGGVSTGVFLVRHGSDYVQHFEAEVGNSDELISNNIWDIFEDKTGLIWIATGLGINLIDPNSLNITYIKPSTIIAHRKNASNTVVSIIGYRKNVLTGSYGAIYKTPLGPQGNGSTSVFTFVDYDHYGDVTALKEDYKGGLFAGTQWSYLFSITPQGAVKKIWHPGLDIGEKPRAIHRIVQEDEQHVYLGTFGGGLLRYDLAKSKTTRISGTSSTELLSNDIVEDMLQPSASKLWVGTFRGLFQFDIATGRSTLVPMTPGSTEPVVQGLYEDPQHMLWIATYDGLWRIKLDPQGNPLTQPEAIPQFHRIGLLSIEQDERGYLWLSTISSLIQYNPSNGSMTSFGRDQGSPMTEYVSYGRARASDGSIWFGGEQGAIGFQPEDLKPNKHAPDVVFNGVSVYRDGKPLILSLVTRNNVTLSYQDSISTFDVAATDFAAPHANMYSYRLLGFQSDWTPASPEHLITFTNLNPGRYKLEVRATNNWGTWSAIPAALDITILPPWWRTWWAYAIYFLIIIGSSIGYVYSLKRKIEREKGISASLREANEIKSNFVERLETQVRKATHDLRETLQGVNLKNAELEVAQKRATEGEQVKSQFLAHMSHELRTPLTGVLGYTKLLTSTPLSSEQKDYVGTIRQSSETLLAIINDTLDHSRLEAGKLLIDEVDFDLLEVIESTLELLAPTAYQKRLELVRVVPPDVPLQLRGDPLRLRQVLTNLLSNAIKFTESGSVSVQLKAVAHDERETTIAFTISDTGIGIPAGELPQLFHAYTRSRISTRHHVEGTGLGLSICKKLLDLMGSEIHVKSKVGVGTSFDFQLSFKIHKNAEPRARLPKKIKVLLYDMQPLSNQAWYACLTRLGADIENAVDLESAVTTHADAAVMVLTEHELAQLGELKRRLTSALPPMLILAPRIERQALKDLSETLYHRVLSKTAREKTLYLELQSLLQSAIREDGDAGTRSPPLTRPALDAPLILVADDNRINRRLLVTMLSHAGFRVAEAGNGLELLDLAARGPWDAALLDIHMPGMDGIEAAGRLRASLGDKLPPVIAMSADVMPETRKQVMEGVMDDFMVKPFTEQELVDKLRWHLDRHTRKKRGEVQPS